MNRLFSTPTQALLADVVCWSVLTYLMVVIGWLSLSLAVGGFALLYNGRNANTVIRSKLRNRRDRKEQVVRQANRDEERARQNEIDASYGRELRSLNNRYSR